MCSRQDNPQTCLWRRPHRNRRSSSWQTGTSTSSWSTCSRTQGESLVFLQEVNGLITQVTITTRQTLSVILSDSLDVRWNIFTHISDPNGHPLIKEIEDHDDDKIYTGGSGRCRQLWSDESAHKLDFPHRIFHNTCKGSIHGQPVRYHPNNTGHNQGNLWRSKLTFTLLIASKLAWKACRWTMWYHTIRCTQQSVTQNITVAAERQKRAHLLVTGR